ncbi:MAG: site-specific DNA-methyltransferase [Methanomicrobiaceae archaeon]|nr:site-specific DNA-methyltransferase [Methanomicrobiaceae archaeon]
MARNTRGRGTKTSTFGSSARINHDSSEFYGSRLYAELSQEAGAAEREVPVDECILDTVQCASSESMDALPASSVHLMVTSPPYNVGKVYDDDLSLAEYRAFLSRVWQETYRVLVPGGRVCINIANLGRKPYIPLHAYVIEDMAKLGFLLRGEIIWNKSSSSGVSTAWGSWMSAANPTLRDVHEYILVFSKGQFGRKKMPEAVNTITKEEFLEFTKSIWSFPTTSAKKIGHPAPFPVDLPYRCIQLYTFADDVVLDPFMGSGQTAIAALRAGRHFVGYETSEEYVSLARKRIEDEYTTRT